MRYISLFYLAFIMITGLFTEAQATNIPNIVAVVNDTPITIQEFRARKQFLKFVNNAHNLSPAAEVQLNRTALKTLIDEQLFFNEAKKFKIEVTEQDINNAIRNIEKNNNMSPGQFISNLKAHNIGIDSLKQQIKSQIIKEQLVHGFLARNVDVNRNEVNEMAELSNKDSLYKFKKITALHNDKASQGKLSSLKKKLNNCQIDEKLYKDFAKIEEVLITAQQLSEPLKSQSLKLKPGQASEVLYEGNDLVIYVLCSKEIAGIKENEYDYIENALANKKISILAQRYYEKLKRKAYIKIYLKQ